MVTFTHTNTHTHTQTHRELLFGHVFSWTPPLPSLPCSLYQSNFSFIHTLSLSPSSSPSALHLSFLSHWPLSLQIFLSKISFLRISLSVFLRPPHPTDFSLFPPRFSLSSPSPAPLSLPSYPSLFASSSSSSSSSSSHFIEKKKHCKNDQQYTQLKSTEKKKRPRTSLFLSSPLYLAASAYNSSMASIWAEFLFILSPSFYITNLFW